MTVRAECVVLGWRTRRGRSTDVHYLDVLADGLSPRGYACTRGDRPPVLWVVASGPRGHVRAAIGVRATPRGTWGYHEAGRYLCPCGDADGATELVDRILKHRMFPATW
ncbi:hypothetical protein BJF79_39145 [Actinomadura sp. CNU-125]|nr:hypothetical protein BJF79_39145 [Actinomadura sp. CNU-125]